MDEIQDGKTEPTPAAFLIFFLNFFFFLILLSQEGVGRLYRGGLYKTGHWAGISSAGNPGSTCP